MRRSLIFLGILLLALFVAMPAVAGRGSDEQGATYQVQNHHHIGTLGGKSHRAHRGLEIAAHHSGTITDVEEITDEDPDKDPVTDPILEPIIDK